MMRKLNNPAATLPGIVLALGMTAGDLVGLATDAAAATVQPGPPWSIQSSVYADVTNNGNGTWSYQYTVYNTSVNQYGGVWDTPVIVDWEVPYFGDAGITSIASPASGWNWAVETIGIENPATGWSGIAAWQDPSDPFYQGASSPFTTVTKVLHWFVQLATGQPSDVGIWPYGATGIPPGAHEGSLTGFGFNADFGPIDGPYQASWYLVPTPRSGDPPLPGGMVPASPCALGQCESVPVPGTLLLIGAGLALIGFRRHNGSV